MLYFSIRWRYTQEENLLEGAKDLKGEGSHPSKTLNMLPELQWNGLNQSISFRVLGEPSQSTEPNPIENLLQWCRNWCLQMLSLHYFWTILQTRGGKDIKKKSHKVVLSYCILKIFGPFFLSCIMCCFVLDCNIKLRHKTLRFVVVTWQNLDKFKGYKYLSKAMCDSMCNISMKQLCLSAVP